MPNNSFGTLKDLSSKKEKMFVYTYLGDTLSLVKGLRKS